MHLFYRQKVKKKLISSCLRISPIRNPISHSEFEKRISIMDKMLWNKVRGVNRENCSLDIIRTMVFCYQNCSDLLWEKIVLFSDRVKLLKLEAEGREFANFLRSLEQFIQTVKGQKNFW